MNANTIDFLYPDKEYEKFTFTVQLYYADVQLDCR